MQPFATPTCRTPPVHSAPELTAGGKATRSLFTTRRSTQLRESRRTWPPSNGNGQAAPLLLWRPMTRLLTLGRGQSCGGSDALNPPLSLKRSKSGASGAAPPDHATLTQATRSAHSGAVPRLRATIDPFVSEGESAGQVRAGEQSTRLLRPVCVYDRKSTVYGDDRRPNDATKVRYGLPPGRTHVFPQTGDLPSGTVACKPRRHGCVARQSPRSPWGTTHHFFGCAWKNCHGKRPLNASCSAAPLA